MNNLLLTIFVSGPGEAAWTGEGREEHRYTTSAELLYERVRGLLPQLLNLNKKDSKSLLMKTAIKGIFLMYGDWMLEQIFQSKEHPKPGKQDDIVLWYIDVFAKVLIMQATKSEYLAYGVESIDGSTFIDQLSSRPVSQAIELIGQPIA